MDNTPEGWSEWVIRDLAPKRGLVGGPFGSSLGSKDYVLMGVPVIRGQNLSGAGKFDGSEFVYVSEGKADELSRNIALPGDLVFTQRGTLGQVGIVPVGNFERYVISQSQMRLRPDPDVADVGFLYYVFRSPQMLDMIDSRAIITGVPHINLGILGDFPILLPPLTEQRAIAGVLGALDDKIESNHRAWKISTDLVRSEYAALVAMEPGSTCQLSDICDFNARALKSGSPDETIRYIDISSVGAGVVTGECETRWADAPSRARRSVTDGDVIFSTVRPARMAYSMMFDPESSTIVSTGFAVMSPKGVPSTLLFAIVSDSEFGKYCDSVSQGSAYPAVSPSAMGNYEVKRPEIDVLAGFGERTEQILRRAHQGLQENRALASLRDALLPELLSGRLRVKDAASMMECVG